MIEQANDAIALLTKDHQDVQELFDAYQRLVDREASAEERLSIAKEICDALALHATVEEEIFYPALRRAADDAKDDLNQAQVEHAAVKELVTQIQLMDPDDELYDAKIKVLCEYVEHHVQEEEGEIFPKARACGLELGEIGQRITARKEDLHTFALAD
jgi:hemerythrin superfamily protein